MIIIDVHKKSLKNKYIIRKVTLTNKILHKEINIEQVDSIVEQMLALVWKYGQNELQFLDTPSVTVGDIAYLFHHYWLRINDGWVELTDKEIAEGKYLS